MPESFERDDSGLPLAAWREVWQALEAPEPPEELRDVDPETRAAVEWMRSAWDQLDVPVAAGAPIATGVRPARGDLLRLRPLLAAAASVLVVFGSTVFLARQLADNLQPETLAARDAVVTSVGDNNIEFRSGPVRLVLVTGD